MKTSNNIREDRIIPLKSDPCCAPAFIQIDGAGVADQVQLLSALADPTRLQIVDMLSGLDEPLCVCDIQGHFELGQPTISHHLRVLREAGLVHSEKRGLWVYYSLVPVALERLTSHLNRMTDKSKQLSVPHGR